MSARMSERKTGRETGENEKVMGDQKKNKKNTYTKCFFAAKPLTHVSRNQNKPNN